MVSASIGSHQSGISVSTRGVQCLNSFVSPLDSLSGWTRPRKMRVECTCNYHKQWCGFSNCLYSVLRCQIHNNFVKERFSLFNESNSSRTTNFVIFILFQLYDILIMYSSKRAQFCCLFFSKCKFSETTLKQVTISAKFNVKFCDLFSL